MVSPYRNPSQSVRGFTLLELLVVLAIASMLTALVPPLLSAVVPGMQSKAAARELAAVMREARHLAISRSTTIDVVIDLETQTYTVTGNEPEEMPSGEVITIPGEARSTLRFYADGSSNGISARLGRGDSGYTIAVDRLMGRVTVSEAQAVAR